MFLPGLSELPVKTGTENIDRCIVFGVQCMGTGQTGREGGGRIVGIGSTFDFRIIDKQVRIAKIKADLRAVLVGGAEGQPGPVIIRDARGAQG